MKTRRDFLISGLTISAGLFSCCKFNLFGADKNSLLSGDKPDIKSLSFCCVECNSKSCPLFKATVENDIEAKKKIAVSWDLKNENGETATIDQVFCYGCKNEEKEQNSNLLRCTVRKCVKEKKLESCALCGELETCEKDLWKKWPKLKEKVLDTQKQING